MNVPYAEHGRRRGRKGFTTLLAILVAMVAAPPIASFSSTALDTSVIVRAAPGTGDASERLVEALGGRIGQQLGIIDAFVAELPASNIASLEADQSVLSVTPNYQVQLLGWKTNPGHKRGTMELATTTVLDADEFWNDGFRGDGVDVALIDSGVVPVNGLTTPGKVINGADFSFESQTDNLRYLDTSGHGTHIAGIIAGRDLGVNPNDISTKTAKHGTFLGVAPNSRIVNVKVADAQGATDVSQVIAAIDWVVQHRNDHGMNIRVLNLSFGTNGKQNYRIDPLAYAVEMAWRRGIVVVVAAGNNGNGSSLRNPAYDPFVIAVGADEANGSREVTDDYIPDFSNCGRKRRHVDVVAPGNLIVSLRAPGSAADENYRNAVVKERFFRGSGTSQAAAMVSGAAALIVQQRPEISPDQVKALLMGTARPIPDEPLLCQGSGLIDLKGAFHAETPAAFQKWQPSTGTGSLEAARGSAHVYDEGVALEGEQDIFGAPWDGASWSQASWTGTSWSGGDWNGNTWTGASWSGASWSGASWSGASWSGASWSGASWSSKNWSGASWSGASWSGGSWSGGSWSGSSWSGDAWSGSSWQ